MTIEEIEKEIIERAFAEGWVAAEPPRAHTGRKVAVVGSGPAGLAAAQQLARAGHRVIVYEAAARPGGLLRYGIPDFKMEKWVIDRRLAQLEAEGVAFRCGALVGRDPTWDRLRAEHDAVVIAIGAQRGRDLDVPGRDLGGVVMAMDYLIEQNQVGAGEKDAATWDVRGKRVVILGGGDTGSDCLGTALRQGAASVEQIELMPAPPPARAEDNPWPQWPMIFRTSSSQEEGGERGFGIMTTRLEGDGGTLTALHAVRVAGPDGRAPRHPGELIPVPGGEVRIPVDTLILALGFTGPSAAPLADQLGVALDARGNVAVDASYQPACPACSPPATPGAAPRSSSGRSPRAARRRATPTPTCAAPTRGCRRAARTCRSAGADQSRTSLTAGQAPAPGVDGLAQRGVAVAERAVTGGGLAGQLGGAARRRGAGGEGARARA